MSSRWLVQISKSVLVFLMLKIAKVNKTQLMKINLNEILYCLYSLSKYLKNLIICMIQLKFKQTINNIKNKVKI